MLGEGAGRFCPAESTLQGRGALSEAGIELVGASLEAVAGGTERYAKPAERPTGWMQTGLSLAGLLTSALTG